MKTQIYQKVDPYSKEVFQTTRRNQKFATRKNQIKYNNRKAAHKKNLINFPVNNSTPSTDLKILSSNSMTAEMIWGFIVSGILIGFVIATAVKTR